MTDQTPSHPGDQAAQRDPGFASTSSSVFGRDVSYIDAVYGFAATLLISNVDAPPAKAWQSWDALVASGLPTQVLGFVLSFTVIAVFWRLNVRLTHSMKGWDTVTTILNLVAAASVVFFAFTTQGISDPRSNDLPLPTVLYAANVIVVSLCMTAMYQLARARGLLRHPTSRRRNLLDLAAALVTPVVFLVSIPVALTWGAVPGRLSWATLIVISPIIGIVAARSQDAPSATSTQLPPS
jgi:uncharacterized membrane protein